ncbi:LANO_0B08262g1_1 [Lachancea nothofagi CBS 11611]|uniref:LANO_0B08262g1_1 n=1 Tax=Lachancea nothofagi CBS 11611 TaxID=1266666 RepID=A0A1G4J0G7_9SACH|nr:LANO_0B08262g1_1 [Lachancea nothofagi CBS 11611]
MSKYAWYTRVTDAAHRLTVLSLVGGTMYMAGGLVYTMYKNGTKYEQQVTQKAADSETETLQ